MGSIRHIYSLKNWKVIYGSKSKINKDDYIYQISIGYCEDELDSGEICLFISKENYDNLLSGKYFAKIFPYCNQKIIIFNNDYNVIPLIKGKKDEEYETSQKEYIKKYKINR